jgi:hypothetical protein
VPAATLAYALDCKNLFSMNVVRDFCRGHVATVRCAVLYEKPTTIVQADFVWRRTDRWIDFPWSS